MKVIQSSIPEVIIMEPSAEAFVYRNVTETYALAPMLKNHLDIRFYSEGETLVERSGTLCGIYYETGHDVQGKMIRCASGGIILCVVDMRIDKESIGKSLLIKINSENKRQVYLPEGFGFGFITQTDNVFLQYKFEKYCPTENWKVLNAFAKDLSIRWPLPDKLTMSARDKYAPDFAMTKRTLWEMERLINSDEKIVEGDDTEECEGME